MQNFYLFIRLPSIFITNMITSQRDIFYVFKKQSKHCDVWLHPNIVKYLNNLYKNEFLKIVKIFLKFPESLIIEILNYLYICEFDIMHVSNYFSKSTITHNNEKNLHIYNFEVII